MSKVSTFIISNYSMFQHGLKSLLSQQSEVEVVGRARTPDQALDQVKVLHPDVVILDSTNLPDDPNFVLKRIFRACPNVKVICLNLHSNLLAIYRLVEPKSAEFQVLRHKVEDPTDLMQAIGYVF
jgi:DNA-binding NarL/FixJ family response regulator